MQKKTNWSALGLAVLLLGAIGAPFIANNQSDDNANSIDAIATQLTALDEKVDAGLTVDVNVDEGILTTEIHDKLFEDDAWEAEAEVLAMEELENDDYEDLYDYLDGIEGISIDDEDDIDKVVVRDVTINGDVDDKDATVTLKLRVYYENSDGDNKKETVYAVADIQDGEVDRDLDFYEYNPLDE